MVVQLGHRPLAFSQALPQQDVYTNERGANHLTSEHRIAVWGWLGSQRNFLCVCVTNGMWCIVIDLHIWMILTKYQTIIALHYDNLD